MSTPSAQPLVSIVIPVFDKENYLGHCLHSLQAHTHHPIEIIVVDDGSTDGSRAIAEELAAHDTRIVVVNQPNAGVSAARNAGLAAARGTYVMFVDPDDWLDEQAINECVALIEQTDADIVQFGYITEPDAGVYLPTRAGLQDATTMFRTLLTGRDDCAAAVWGLLVKAQRLRDAGQRFLPQMKRGEDVLYMAGLYAHGLNAYCLRKPFYHYRAGVGVSGTYLPEAIRAVDTFCKTLLVTEEQSTVARENHDAIIDFCTRFYLAALAIELKNPAHTDAHEKRTAFERLCTEPHLRSVLTEGRALRTTPVWARLLAWLVTTPSTHHPVAYRALATLIALGKL